MPADYNGTWDIVTNVNFEGYMVAIGEYMLVLYVSYRLLYKRRFKLLENFTSFPRDALRDNAAVSRSPVLSDTYIILLKKKS